MSDEQEIPSLECFCKLKLMNKDSLLPHMEINHSMETIQLTKPVADIKLELSSGNATSYLPYHLSIGFASLIVIISHIKNPNRVNVRVSNITDVPGNMKFMAMFTHKGIGYSKYGTVSDHFTCIFTKDSIHIPSLTNTLVLKIYLDNYEKIESVIDCFESILQDFECPICMEIISDSCYQCANDHNICDKCKKMIDICPTCRSCFKDSAVTMKRLMGNVIRPCKNAANGCFVYNKNSEIVDHERICLMGQFRCELCNDDFHINAYIEHMTIQHKMQKMLNDTQAIVKPGFIFYKDKVLDFTVKYEHVLNSKLCVWSLRLIYSFEKICSKEYEMAIKIGEKMITFKQNISDLEDLNICKVDSEAILIYTLNFLF